MMKRIAAPPKSSYRYVLELQDNIRNHNVDKILSNLPLYKSLYEEKAFEDEVVLFTLLQNYDNSVATILASNFFSNAPDWVIGELLRKTNEVNDKKTAMALLQNEQNIKKAYRDTVINEDMEMLEFLSSFPIERTDAVDIIKFAIRKNKLNVVNQLVDDEDWKKKLKYPNDYYEAFLTAIDSGNEDMIRAFYFVTDQLNLFLIRNVLRRARKANATKFVRFLIKKTLLLYQKCSTDEIYKMTVSQYRLMEKVTIYYCKQDEQFITDFLKLRDDIAFLSVDDQKTKSLQKRLEKFKIYPTRDELVTYASLYPEVFPDVWVLEQRLQFFPTLRKEIQQRKNCIEYKDENLWYIKGPRSLSWIKFGGKDIFLFGEHHGTQTLDCPVQDELDVKRDDIVGLPKFFGSNCSFYTFPRFLYATYANTILKTNNNIDFFVERDLLLFDVDIERYNKLEGSESQYLAKIHDLFFQCLVNNKVGCNFLPQVWMHATDYRTINPDSVQLSFLGPRFKTDYTILNQLYYQYGRRRTKEIGETITPYIKWVNYLYGTKFKDLDFLGELLSSDHVDKYLLRQFGHLLDERAIDEPKIREEAPQLMIEYQAMLNALYKLKYHPQNAGFIKVLPDGRVVTKVRAQLIGLDKDGVYYKGKKMSDIILEYFENFKKKHENELTFYDKYNKSGNISVGGYPHITYYAAVYSDSGAIARVLRTFNGRRSADTTMSYFGDYHKQNWVKFFTTMLDATVVEETIHDPSKKNCLPLGPKTRDKFLELTGGK